MASQPKANCHDKSNLLPEASRGHSETRVVDSRCRTCEWRRCHWLQKFCEERQLKIVRDCEIEMALSENRYPLFRWIVRLFLFSPLKTSCLEVGGTIVYPIFRHKRSARAGLGFRGSFFGLDPGLLCQAHGGNDETT